MSLQVLDFAIKNYDIIETSVPNNMIDKLLTTHLFLNILSFEHCSMWVDAPCAGIQGCKNSGLKIIYSVIFVLIIQLGLSFVQALMQLSWPLEYCDLIVWLFSPNNNIYFLQNLDNSSLINPLWNVHLKLLKKRGYHVDCFSHHWRSWRLWKQLPLLSSGKIKHAVYVFLVSVVFSLATIHTINMSHICWHLYDDEEDLWIMKLNKSGDLNRKINLPDDIMLKTHRNLQC